MMHCIYASYLLIIFFWKIEKPDNSRVPRVDFNYYRIWCWEAGDELGHFLEYKTNNRGDKLENLIVFLALFYGIKAYTFKLKLWS